MLIPKTWGHEDIVVNEEAANYCGKVLFVKQQYQCSIHKHKIKDETFLLRQGAIWLETGVDPNKLTGNWIQENQRIRIVPETWHRFTALRDSELVEFSTFHRDEDSIRHCNGGKVSEQEYRAFAASYISDLGRDVVVTVDVAGAISERLKKEGKTVGFVNGVFDMLHPGHVELLKQAKNRCEFLFVATNSDDAVRRLKGPTRPVMNEFARLSMLSANKFVDYVILAEGTTCLDVVEAVKPNVYVTTSEYGNSGPEARETIALGGIVEVVEKIPGYSTTSILAGKK